MAIANKDSFLLRAWRLEVFGALWSDLAIAEADKAGFPDGLAPHFQTAGCAAACNTRFPDYVVAAADSRLRQMTCRSLS